MNDRKTAHGLFILLAVMILLAGAAAAGVAARTVVDPRTGEVRSAGQVSVPTVLGQTADEVLFYPWSVYSMEERFSAAGKLGDDFDEGSSLFLSEMFPVLDLAEADQTVMYQMMEVNAQGSHMYVRNFPCRLTGGVPVTLNFALSEGDTWCLSAVVSPAEPEELSQARQDAALERVKADLHAFLLMGPASDIGSKLSSLEDLIRVSANEVFCYPITALMGTVWAYALDLGTADIEVADGQLIPHLDEMGVGDLEETIDRLDSYGWSVQLVTTPSQVVAVMSSGSTVVGVYYDIQLEQYSGFGIQA